MQNYGFKVVFSSRFADIFRGNSLKGGLLTVILPEVEIESLWQVTERDPATEIEVDLESRTVRYSDGGKEYVIPFEMDDFTRWRLMEGLDDIGLTLRHTSAVDQFEAKRADFKPTTLPVRS